MDPNPYDESKSDGSISQAAAKWPSFVATFTTMFAAIAVAIFWVMIADYYRGGHSGDQLIKLGADGTAICLAMPLACIAFSILAWEAFAQRVVSYASAALMAVNLAVLASPLIYWLD